MPDHETLVQLHPCLSDTLGQYGRIHLPVCPSCNLACRYCKRSLTSKKEVPGVSRRILPLDEVADVIKKAKELCPEITTVGIAGPGDTLATPHALEAFRIVDRCYPELIKCMSTNGLLLAEKAEEISRVKVDSVTVTVNAVHPEIESRINSRIFYKGSWIEKEEAAKILIRNQLEGIRKSADLGLFIKVNMVLIPGVNDRHIQETARAVSEAGAKLCNIIPLIPQAGLADNPAPDCEQLHAAREDASEYLRIFSHCQHCRADAVGRLGKKDLGGRIYGNSEFEEENFSHG